MSGDKENKTKQILDKYLDKDFSCFAGGDDAPTRKELDALARKLDIRFPDEFIEHSTSKFGGAYVEVKEEVWPRPKPFEVGPFWSFLYGLFVYSLSADSPEWMNLEIAANEFREEFGHRVVPFLKILGNADCYCFDHNGVILLWDHELDEFEPVDKNFFQLFEDEIKELKERKERKKSAGGNPA